MSRCREGRIGSVTRLLIYITLLTKLQAYTNKATEVTLVAYMYNSPYIIQDFDWWHQRDPKVALVFPDHVNRRTGR
ncbi:MAG: hypothetical protein RL538_761 [Candidatus Parcubacteria bacterium]